LTGEKFWRLGFVLPPEKEGGPPRRFSIFKTSEIPPDQVEAVEPVAAGFLGTVTSESFDLAESFYQDHTLLFAIQCHARGWHELARAAYKPYGRDPKFLRRILAMWARDAAMDRLRDPAVDRHTVLQHLKACADASPRSEDQRSDPLIADLEATVASPPPATEAARWIDQLLEVTHVRRNRNDTSYEDDPAWGYHPIYAAMLGQWFDRMPLLLEHVDDRRITRCALAACAFERYRFGDSSVLRPGEYPARLGDLVKRLIADVAGQEFRDQAPDFDLAAAKAWWVTTQKTGEESWLSRSAVRLDVYRRRSVNAPQLFLLVSRYPKLFTELYRRLLQEDLEAGSDDLALAVRNAPLEAEARTALWVEGTNAHTFRMRSLSLQALFKEQHPDAVSLFLQELKRHPSTPPGEYWTCEPPCLLGILRWTEDDAAWRAFLRFTKASDVGQRAEIIHHVGYTYLEQQVIGKRLAFAAHFLEDRTVCDPSSGPKYEGVPAANFLGKITIRNLTASTLGGLLRHKPYPEKNWTAEQWETYIQKLKQDDRMQRAGAMAP
jgi:hypothetical protein